MSKLGPPGPPLCRDVDETISWIKEKEQLMASDDFGRDLASVQALLRKHEGLERDLAALEDKVGPGSRWPCACPRVRSGAQC